MSTPSLLLVPARLKAGTLFSQIPTNGSGDFTVVQASGNATRYNSSGFVESAKTNLALQSENFGTTWSLLALLPFGSGSVLNTTATLDPYGTNVADLIVANTTVTQHRVDQTTTSVSGSYVFSVFLKAEGYGFARLRIGGQGAIFNLSTGVVIGTDSVITSSIQSFGNGWYRCIIGKAASAANEIIRINMQPTASTADFAGDGTSGIYVFGAQYETGSVATSYIPTTTAAVTRNADVVTVSGAVSGSIGQTEGVLYIECEANNATDDVFNINRSAANSITVYKNVNNSYLGRIYHSSTSIIFTSASGVTGTVKIAIAYKSGDSTMYLNGSRVGTLNTTAITFGAALNYLGVDKSSAFYEGVKPSRILSAALYTTRLTDTQLALLTSPYTSYSSMASALSYTLG